MEGRTVGSDLAQTFTFSGHCEIMVGSNNSICY
jgi:hypothetical protein